MHGEETSVGLRPCKNDITSEEGKPGSVASMLKSTGTSL